MGDDNRSHHEYARVVVSDEGAAAREIRIYGSGDRLILEGWKVADDDGQTAWISDAGAIAVFGQPLYPGETTEAGRCGSSTTLPRSKRWAPVHHRSWLRSPRPSASGMSLLRPNFTAALQDKVNADLLAFLRGWPAGLESAVRPVPGASAREAGRGGTCRTGDPSVG